MAFLAALSLAAPALGADLPVKAPIYKAPVADVWSWDGFYIGVNAGYSWGRAAIDATFSAAPLPPDSGSEAFDMDGWLGGLQIGKNWQSNNWVWGVEADVQATGQKVNAAASCGFGFCTTTTVVPPLAATVSGTYNQKLDWFGTLRPRAGVTITPTLLAYVTGGLAWGVIKSDGTLSGFSALAAVSAPYSSSTTKVGWTIGGGIESRISGNWTAKLEYLYIDFGTVDATATLPTNAPPLTGTASSKITDNILRAGLNYKF